MKDALCAETNAKSYIRFFRFLVFELLAPKKVFQKWPSLQGSCGLIWQWLFSSWIFFVRLLVFGIQVILSMFVYKFQVFLPTKYGQKWFSCQKMCNVLIRVFFVRFLVYELWSILYSTMVNSRWDLAKNLAGLIAKYAVDANQWGSGPQS